MKVSLIMPVERLGGDAQRAIASVLEQQVPFAFELIAVSAEALPPQTGVRNVVETNRNPATRRNRAVSVAAGEILAFIDDDARAAPGWLANAAAIFDARPDVLAVGGPDPAPDDSTIAELISETLLATPLIGSGVAAHENRAGTFDVRRASDVALVNLFVRRDAFTGFDESIGYIGEDTALVEELMRRGRVVYSDQVRVFHRRRAFPGEYLRQRWRYRVKTGELLVRGSKSHRANPKIWAFLLVGAISIIASPLAVIPYYVATLIVGTRATRLPKSRWPLIPFYFAAHHLTYFAGIVWGAARAVFFRARRRLPSG
jgi:glycosyltransferase involved in cell wall biosynthesis